MADSFSNRIRPGVMPELTRELRSMRGAAILLLIIAGASALSALAQSGRDIAALAACISASLSLLACAAVLTTFRSSNGLDRLARGSDALALFGVALLAPTLVLNDWTRSDVTAALLVAGSAICLWVSRVASGTTPNRIRALNAGCLGAVAVCVAVWFLQTLDWLSSTDALPGAIALVAIAPIFAVGAAGRRLVGIALGTTLGASVAIASLVPLEYKLLLSILWVLGIGTFIATRRLDDLIDPRVDLRAVRSNLWLAVASLISLMVLATLLDEAWSLLAVASFAVVSAGTIAAQGVDIVDRERLLVRLTRLNQLTAHQARLDPLTRLPNRAALDARLNEEVERAIRYRQPASVLFIDADHFKGINDCHGHEAGDRALREIATTIRQSIRTPDFVARFGGEEFVVIAPGTWAVDALVLGSRIQRGIGKAIRHSDGQPVTVSIGIAGIPEHAVSAEEALRKADEALYRAKRSGRDCVVVSDISANQDVRDNS